jgi:SAM-dependent methyltransferase
VPGVNGFAVTRGEGKLELFLARQRAKLADSLIPFELRKGRIADVGCGSYPYFLSRVEFSAKVGLDNVNWNIGGSPECSKIRLIRHDLQSGDPLPLEIESCDVISMLAVIEHIEPSVVPSVLKEVRRALRPGGLFVMTTPAPWTDSLLRVLANMRIISKHEIDDHKDALSLSRIRSMLVAAGFKSENIASGHFEIFMNCWAIARKDSDRD